MASASTQHVLLSPAELAYLHSTLSLSPPIRPDGRTPTQFRPLTAETAILPGTNGSARICFADGTEAIVGVKAEVANTRQRHVGAGPSGDEEQQPEGEDAGAARVYGEPEWVELTVEIPGLRDDDANTVFLAELLSEALLADGEFAKKLWINSRFHWKLYLDVRAALQAVGSFLSPSIREEHMPTQSLSCIPFFGSLPTAAWCRLPKAPRRNTALAWPTANPARTGDTYFSAAIVPPAPTITHDTPRPAGHAAAPPKV